MARNWWAAALCEDNALRARALDFVLFPARYIHESWIDDLVGAEIWRQLTVSRRTEALLSHYILERVGAHREDDLEFQTASSRLALLDGSVLTRLIRHVGVALSAGQIARFVDRSSIVMLESSLGPDAYNFALRRAPLLVGEIEGIPLWERKEEMAGFCDRLGGECLASALTDEPSALVNRLRLKLDKGFRLRALEGVRGWGPERAIAIFRRIAREIEPRWNSLLT